VQHVKEKAQIRERGSKDVVIRTLKLEALTFSVSKTHNVKHSHH